MRRKRDCISQVDSYPTLRMLETSRLLVGRMQNKRYKETLDEFKKIVTIQAQQNKTNEENQHEAHVKKLVESAEGGGKEMHRATEPTPRRDGNAL